MHSQQVECLLMVTSMVQIGSPLLTLVGRSVYVAQEQSSTQGNFLVLFDLQAWLDWTYAP